jgi:hypothetical protein
MHVPVGREGEDDGPVGVPTQVVVGTGLVGDGLAVHVRLETGTDPKVGVWKHWKVRLNVYPIRISLYTSAVTSPNLGTILTSIAFLYFA